MLNAHLLWRVRGDGAASCCLGQSEHIEFIERIRKEDAASSVRLYWFVVTDCLDALPRTPGIKDLEIQ